MSAHPLDLLSGYLDGDLDAGARRDIDRHLAGCAECRAVVADLETVRQAASAWAKRADAPAPDLWPAIASRLTGPRESASSPGDGGAASVIAITSHPAWYRRRFSLGLPELAAAAALVAAVSGALMASRPGVSSPAASTGSPAPVVAEVEYDSAGVEAVPASFADAQYDAAVIDLERVLLEQRERLDPRTVVVLERNLRVIDDAIREARQALAADPANALLNAHLAGARQRKLDLLRRAASITEGD